MFALQGLVVMSGDLDDVFNNMLVGKVPAVWAASSPFPEATGKLCRRSVGKVRNVCFLVFL